jgi:hypothetical protein
VALMGIGTGGFAPLSGVSYVLAGIVKCCLTTWQRMCFHTMRTWKTGHLAAEYLCSRRLCRKSFPLHTGGAWRCLLMIDGCSRLSPLIGNPITLAMLDKYGVREHVAL